jgi:molybdopterin synthase sulfur carrier subunit
MDQSEVLKGVAAGTISVKVVFFARLREALGSGGETVALPAAAATVEGLRDQLRRRGGMWESELAPPRAVRVAVNQDMATQQTVLKPGDEVAFFPPVTGG